MNINVTIDSGVAEVDDYLARQLRALVERVASPQVRTGVELPTQRRNFREKEYTTDQARILELLHEAKRMRAPVDVTYEAIRDGVFTRRDFSPVQVWKQAIPTGGVGWYARGYCHAREEPRVFRVDHIRALEVR